MIFIYEWQIWITSPPPLLKAQKISWKRGSEILRKSDQERFLWNSLLEMRGTWTNSCHIWKHQTSTILIHSTLTHGKGRNLWGPTHSCWCLGTDGPLGRSLSVLVVWLMIGCPCSSWCFLISMNSQEIVVGLKWRWEGAWGVIKIYCSHVWYYKLVNKGWKNEMEVALSWISLAIYSRVMYHDESILSFRGHLLLHYCLFLLWMNSLSLLLDNILHFLRI